jgi:hypothetical protein
MINHLGLDSYALKMARRAAIDMAYQNVGYETDIKEKVLQEEIEFNTVPNQDGELPPFCDAVTYALGNLV